MYNLTSNSLKSLFIGVASLTLSQFGFAQNPPPYYPSASVTDTVQFSPLTLINGASGMATTEREVLSMFDGVVDENSLTIYKVEGSAASVTGLTNYGRIVPYTITNGTDGRISSAVAVTAGTENPAFTSTVTGTVASEIGFSSATTSVVNVGWKIEVSPVNVSSTDGGTSTMKITLRWATGGSEKSQDFYVTLKTVVGTVADIGPMIGASQNGEGDFVVKWIMDDDGNAVVIDTSPLVPVDTNGTTNGTTGGTTSGVGGSYIGSTGGTVAIETGESGPYNGYSGYGNINAPSQWDYGTADNVLYIMPEASGKDVDAAINHYVGNVSSIQLAVSDSGAYGFLVTGVDGSTYLFLF